MYEVQIGGKQNKTPAAKCAGNLGETLPVPPRSRWQWPLKGIYSQSTVTSLALFPKALEQRGWDGNDVAGMEPALLQQLCFPEAPLVADNRAAHAGAAFRPGVLLWAQKELHASCPCIASLPISFNNQLSSFQSCYTDFTNQCSPGRNWSPEFLLNPFWDSPFEYRITHLCDPELKSGLFLWALCTHSCDSHSRGNSWASLLST